MTMNPPAIHNPRFSVIVPAYNAEMSIAALLDSLFDQSFDSAEVIVVDDKSSDRTAAIVKSYPVTLIENTHNRGPAHCRNAGAAVAHGEILAFTDSDCIAADNWLERLDHHFQRGQTDAVMGRLVLMPSNFLGDSISALGFPAGGTIGFDKIWRVDARGYTSSLSTCNCALRRAVFAQVGGFDESFPYAGGEDSFLAYNLRQSGYRIRYCPDVCVYHPARDSIPGFIRWQYKRGISSYLFARKITARRSYLSLRLWSTGNILRRYLRDVRFPLIVTLLAAGYTAQLCGYLRAYTNRSPACTF